MVQTNVAITTTYISYGLNPSWSEQTEVSSPPGDPPASGVGISVLDSVVALLRVQLREKPGYHRGRVWVPSGGVQNSQTYTVTINGVAHNFVSDATATEQEILDGLKAAILAGVQPVGVTQEIYDSKNVLLIESTNTPPAVSTFTLATSATGAATMDDWIEPTSVTFDVWSTAKDQTVMDMVDGFTTITITKNWIQRIECGGVSELFIVPTATNGDVRMFVGPCVEST